MTDVNDKLNSLKQELKETEMESTETKTTAKKTAAKKAPAKKAPAPVAKPKVIVKKGIGATKTKEEPAAKADSKASGDVTLKQLCQELKLKPAMARRKLRAAKMHADGRYSWAPKSDELAKVREILGG